MTCDVSLASYNDIGLLYMGIALVLCCFGLIGSLQAFLPVSNMRLKVLWVWVGFFSGAALMGMAELYQQLYRQLNTVFDIASISNSTVVIPQNCTVLRDIRAYFGILASTDGLNWFYLLAGGAFFVISLIGLLAYMWIPPLIQHEQSRP